MATYKKPNGFLTGKGEVEDIRVLLVISCQEGLVYSLNEEYLLCGFTANKVFSL